MFSACQSIPSEKNESKYLGSVLVKNTQSQLKSNVVVYENASGIIIQLIKPIVGKIGDIKIGSKGSRAEFVNSDLSFAQDFEKSLQADKGLIMETLSKCLSTGYLNRSFQEMYIVCSKNSENILTIRFQIMNGFSGEFILKKGK
ncbi:MAG: hypothetical protein RI886_538 [Pseudomonadota bacterium]|mgnify:FL=1|jgi:hypothetical protein